MRHRSKALMGLVAALALVAAACTGDSGGEGGTDQGTGSAEPVTLDYWVFESGGLAGTFLEQVIQEFEAENPNVTLNITAYPENNYGVKLDTAIAAGKEPDLVLVFGPEQMREGLLLPLDDMIAEQGIDLSTFVPSIVEPGDEFSCAFEGQLYCLGSYAGSVQMLYNKDMFDAAGVPYPAAWPPMTPEEFVETACQLTDEENGVWGATADGPLAYLPYETFFSDDGRTAEFNSPEAVHQVEVLASGFERGCIPSSNILDPWNTDYLVSGKLGMLITGFQGLTKIENAGINYGTTASPSPVGEEPYFFVWTDSIGVMSSSEHPD
ncbi:MAG: ABC transporter substrate-binding protein, partial [Actinomycetota bacterium]